MTAKGAALRCGLEVRLDFRIVDFAPIKGELPHGVDHHAILQQMGIDPATQGYIRTCQGTKAGDPINPTYYDRVMAAAMINDAIIAYNKGYAEEALDHLFRSHLGGEPLHAGSDGARRFGFRWAWRSCRSGQRRSMRPSRSAWR